MAKYYSSTFGKISGRHGNAVAVVRKDGSTYLRLYAKAGNPRTDKQQAHRAKFALTSRSLAPFNPIFKKTIGITNGISIARSYAFKNAIVGEYPNLSVDYSKLMFSFGTLEKLHNATIAINEAIMTVSWDFKKMYNCHGNDRVSIVVFNKETNQSLHIEDVAMRSDRATKVQVNDSWANDDLCVWAYATQGDKRSDSVFVCNSVETSRSLSGLHVRLEDKLIDNKHIDSPEYFAFNKALKNIIMMICNILCLLKQPILSTNTQNQLSNLIYKPFTNLKHVSNTYNESVLRLNLKSTRKRKFGGLYSKYQNTFTTIPIQIINLQLKI